MCSNLSMSSTGMCGGQGGMGCGGSQVWQPPMSQMGLGQRRLLGMSRETGGGGGGTRRGRSANWDENES